VSHAVAMPLPRRLPADDVVIELVTQRGLTQEQVGSMYGVTRQAVGDCLDRAGIPRPRQELVRSYREFIPWAVAAIHNNDLLVRRLRLYARLQTGGTLTRQEYARLQAWLDYMRTNDAVVTYRPDRGFRLARRAPGETGLVRP
jgi:hypothetical protein